MVVVLTDGHPNPGADGVQSTTETLETLGHHVTVHTLGFTSGHDPELLTRLNLAGDGPSGMCVCRLCGSSRLRVRACVRVHSCVRVRPCMVYICARRASMRVGFTCVRVGVFFV
jgi:hypothetical protein